MELYIYDRSLNLKGIMDNFTSLRWTRRYYKSGEFELQCGLTLDNLQLLTRESIICKKDDKEAGYIEYRKLTQDSVGNEILVVKGKFITSYLNRRILWGTEVFSTTTELAMRTIVNNHCIIPSDSARIIPNLILGTLKNYSDTLTCQDSYTNMADELESLSSTSELGYRLEFDSINKKLIFQVYKGLDRSINQAINPIAIFSKEFDNVLEQEYVDSLNNYRNFALIGGMGDGTARKTAIVGTTSGLDRFEIFVDAKDLQNTKTVNNVEVTITDTEYQAMLVTRGNEKLADTKDITTFDSKINLNSNMEYKKDFDIGDIITIVSKKWNITLSPRITEIEEDYENSGKSINITFGNNIPTILDKIKTIVN